MEIWKLEIKAVLEKKIDILITAQAAIERLANDIKLKHKIKTLLTQKLDIIPLSTSEFIPAPGQGTLCIETNRDIIKNSPKLHCILKKLNDFPTQIVSETERIIMKNVESGCRLPFGAYASIDQHKKTVSINVFLGADDNQKYIKENQSFYIENLFNSNNCLPQNELSSKKKNSYYEFLQKVEQWSITLKNKVKTL